MENSRTVPPFLLKVLITLLVGGLAYVVTNELIGEKDPNAGTSEVIITIFIGGAAILIQYMADFERRLNAVESSMVKHGEEMKEIVGAGFARINEATRLFGILQTSPLPTDGVVQLVRNATDIKSDGRGVINDFAKMEIDRVASLMKDLKADQVEYEGEDRDWILTLTRCSANSIDAVSTEVDATFWPSELGRRYLAAQREAIKEGVKVRRLFIVDRPEIMDHKVLELCRSHQGLGIEVRVAFKSAQPLGGILDPMYGFILFDQAVSYEVIPEDGAEMGNPAIATTRLVLRDERVATRMDRFNDLWDTGVDPEEF